MNGDKKVCLAGGLLIFSLVVAACGGGSGSNSLTSGTFPTTEAFKTVITSGLSQATLTFQANSTDTSGNAITGTETLSLAPSTSPATFGGNSGLEQQVETVIANAVDNGTPETGTSERNWYFEYQTGNQGNQRILPLGSLDTNNCVIVTTASSDIPLTANVGDSGTIGSFNHFDNTCSGTVLGTGTVTWDIIAPSTSIIPSPANYGSDGIYEFTYTENVVSTGKVSVEKWGYLITPSGVLTLAYITVTDGVKLNTVVLNLAL